MKILVLENKTITTKKLLDKFSNCKEFEIIRDDQQLNELCESNEINQFSVILIDWSYSFYKALFFSEKIRNSSDVPIIILSTENSKQQIVKALDRGVDDFLSSPCSIDELATRIKNLAQRPKNLLFKDTKIKINNLEIDIKSQKVTLKGEKISLTNTEYKILFYLIIKNNHIISREELKNRIFNLKKQTSKHLMDMHIFNLRKKIGTDLKIVTIPQAGYTIKNCIIKNYARL